MKYSFMGAFCQSILHTNYTVNLLFAHLSGGAADGDVLEGTAEAAHGVSLEVGKHDE